MSAPEWDGPRRKRAGGESAPERVEVRKIDLAPGQSVGAKALENIKRYSPSEQDASWLCWVLNIDSETGKTYDRLSESEPSGTREFGQHLNRRHSGAITGRRVGT